LSAARESEKEKKKEEEKKWMRGLNFLQNKLSKKRRKKPSSRILNQES